MNPATAVAAGLASGLSLGLVGGGGSIIAVPLLVYLVGLSVHQAIGVSLVAVGVSSLVGAAEHWRGGRVRPAIALAMALPGFPGVYVGSLLNSMVPSKPLLLGFAALMYVMAGRMAYGARKTPSRREGYGRSLVRAAVAGFAVGVLSGFFGIGGGFLIVPALNIAVGLPMHEAVGTSLLIIFFNGLSGLVSYHLQGRPLNPVVTGFFVAGGAVGSAAGARIAGRVSGRTLTLAFSALVASTATYIVLREV